jgi:uncharacterized protein YjbI with pentapeptide repeats
VHTDKFGSTVITEVAFRKVIGRIGISGWNQWCIENIERFEPPVEKNIDDLYAQLRRHIRIDLNGADFAGWIFDGIILRFADCENGNFMNASFRDADLWGIDFSGSRLMGADFTKSDMSLSRLTSTDLRGAIFNNTVLTGIRLNEARLEGCDFSQAINLLSMDELMMGMGINIREIKVKQLTDDGMEIDKSDSLFKG